MASCLFKTVGFTILTWKINSLIRSSLSDTKLDCVVACQETGDDRDRNEGVTERWRGGEVVKCSGAFV